MIILGIGSLAESFIQFQEGQIFSGISFFVLGILFVRVGLFPLLAGRKLEHRREQRKEEEELFAKAKEEIRILVQQNKVDKLLQLGEEATYPVIKAEYFIEASKILRFKGENERCQELLKRAKDSASKIRDSFDKKFALSRISNERSQLK
jgi:hypothetical protein